MIDFIRLLKDSNIDYKQEVNGWIQIKCPWHSNGTRGFKGGINISGNYYNCWNCGQNSLEKVFSELLSISFYEAKKLLREYDTESRIIQKVKKKGLAKNIQLPGNEIAKDSKAWNYLVKRRFDPEYLMKEYKIKDGGITGHWSFRIIIPIFYRNKIVSYQGRSLYSKEKCKELDILRYHTLDISSSVIDAKRILYNLDNCLEDWAILEEGATDVWRLGPKNVCATLGTEMSENQIILLANRFKKIILLFDNEKEAQDRAKKYGQQLAGLGVEVEIFNPEFEHDPGDYSASEEAEVRRELILAM
jgi:DNA primase